jgi:hypothetical protein
VLLKFILYALAWATDDRVVLTVDGANHMKTQAHVQEYRSKSKTLDYWGKLNDLLADSLGQPLYSRVPQEGFTS